MVIKNDGETGYRILKFTVSGRRVYFTIKSTDGGKNSAIVWNEYVTLKDHKMMLIPQKIVKRNGELIRYPRKRNGHIFQFTNSLLEKQYMERLRTNYLLLPPELQMHLARMWMV